MARNSDLDALSALLGLGFIGAIADVAEQSKRGGGNPFQAGVQPGMKKQETNSREPEQKPLTQDELLKQGAESAWKLFNSYISVGFSSEQAFELLKTVLGSKRR